MREGGEGPRPPIIKPGRDPEGHLVKREGFPKPPIGPEDYASPYRKGDGRLVRIDDPNRPPTKLAKLTGEIAKKYTGIGDRIQHTPLGRFATWLTAWREPTKPSGHPAGEFVRSSDVRRAGEVVDLHGPIDDPNTLSPEATRERDAAVNRHPSAGRNVEPGLRLVDPAEVEREIKDEIAGNKKPSAYDEFVDIPVEVYTAGDPKPQPDRSQPNVVDMANGADYRELVEARKLGKGGRHLRSVPDLPKTDSEDEPTPPGGSAA